MACNGLPEYFNEMYLHRIFYRTYFYQYQVPSIVRSLLTKYNVLNTFGCILYCQFIYVYFTKFSSIGFYHKCFLFFFYMFLTLRLMSHEVLPYNRTSVNVTGMRFIKSRTVTHKSNKECNDQSVYSVFI